MLVLNHLENSRSQRVLWLMEELGLDYQVKTYLRDKETSLAPAALKSVHPLGKSPVLEHDGTMVAETAAIVEYLIDMHEAGADGGGWRPTRGTAAYRDYVFWLHFAEGSLMPQLLLKLFFTRIKETKMPFFAKPIARGIADKVLGDYVTPNLETQFEFIESHLQNNAWFAGDDLSGADVMMIFPLEAALQRGGLKESHKATRAYVEKTHARPAYKKALEKGGPYAYA